MSAYGDTACIQMWKHICSGPVLSLIEHGKPLCHILVDAEGKRCRIGDAMISVDTQGVTIETPSRVDRLLWRDAETRQLRRPPIEMMYQAMSGMRDGVEVGRGEFMSHTFGERAGSWASVYAPVFVLAMLWDAYVMTERVHAKQQARKAPAD